MLASMALLPGLIFYMLGAWPVVGFMGLDVVALYWALTWSFRDGKRSEEVTLWQSLSLSFRRGLHRWTRPGQSAPERGPSELGKTTLAP